MRIFGFQLPLTSNQNNLAKEVVRSPVTPERDESTVDVMSQYGSLTGNMVGAYVAGTDFNNIFKNENDLITQYREMSLNPEVDQAIEEIVNDAIVSDEERPPVELRLETDLLDKESKKKLQDEFNEILQLLEFRTKGHDLFRRWYIDGRLYFHTLFDEKKPKEGIKEIRMIDPRRIKKVREFIDPRQAGGPNDEFARVIPIMNYREYYIYSEQPIDNGMNGTMSSVPVNFTGVRLTTESVAQSNSGLFDSSGRIVLSYLHKALRTANQLAMLEAGAIIYYLSRAPERRVFYLDVGNLPTAKAEQFVKETMERFRNKLVYNATTGDIKDEKRFLAMTEDYWLPRRDGSKGTEIGTIPGGQALAQLNEILDYFRNKMYKSLGVPTSRLNSDTIVNVGQTATEITREELKFMKFISRLRARFSNVLEELLKAQLILKGMITEEDWETLRGTLRFDFASDQHFVELKEAEVLMMRLNGVDRAWPYVGKLFSLNQIQRNILKMTDEQIAEVEASAEKDIAKVNPIAPADMMDGGGFGGGPMGGGFVPPPTPSGIPQGGNVQQTTTTTTSVDGSAAPDKDPNESLIQLETARTLRAINESLR